MNANPLTDDFDGILAHTEGLWEELRGRRLFITGGTGFFGCWLLESFLWANDRLGLGASATVLTRDPAAFRHNAPHLAAHPALRLHAGDVRAFDFPEGEFPYVVHAAADTADKLKREDPLRVWDSMVDGTRRVLDFARQRGTRRLLLASSGAVYGAPPAGTSHIAEDFVGGPDCTDYRAAVAEGKRAAEMLCALFSRQYGLETIIARCFAFVGPYLPLDVHYAIGNFIRDGMAGGPIVVKGDGTPFRSYLYAADMAVWLWTILLRGVSLRPYNVGSEEAMSIAEAARRVARVFSEELPVVIRQTPQDGHRPERYVPSTRRAREELGLRQSVGFEDAIGRTVRWHLARPS